jgi:hypothetical protein
VRRSDQTLLEPVDPLGEFLNVRAQSAYLVSVGKIDQGDGPFNPPINLIRDPFLNGIQVQPGSFG